MDPRLMMTLLRKEHDQRMNALTREHEIRQALRDERCRAVRDERRRWSGSRSIAAGVHRALRVVDAGVAGLHRDCRRDNLKSQPGGRASSNVYSGEPAAA